MKLKEILNEVIKKEGNKWVLYSKKGKILGRHDTKKAAQKQEAAIQISKQK
jgi:hypothetical protein